MVSRDISSTHDEPGKLFVDAFGLLSGESVAPDEVAFVQLYDPAEAGLEKRRRPVQIVSIEKK
jgi:hypothetical protein